MRVDPSSSYSHAVIARLSPALRIGHVVIGTGRTTVLRATIERAEDVISGCIVELECPTILPLEGPKAAIGARIDLNDRGPCRARRRVARTAPKRIDAVDGFLRVNRPVVAADRVGV